MTKKRGIKISTSSTLLNKKNIIFMLIFVLLLIMIIYFGIKTWPIMQQRLGDSDDDGVKNYEDKCMSTPIGAPVDSYGCEITEEGKTHRESPLFIKQDQDDYDTEEDTSVVCSDDDGGKNIWKKGVCNDGSEKIDSCKRSFEAKLYEYECLNDVCVKHSIDCEDYNALCYRGACIDKSKDTDDDGYPDLDEFEANTDIDNPNDHPESSGTNGQSDCNSFCVNLGYLKGEGPYDSMGHCDNFEVGKYLSGNSGDVCCCKDCNLWCQDSGWNYGTVTSSSNCDAYPTNYYDMGSSCCCHMESGGQETDTDKDGIPDTIDTDDDNDGYTDSEENNAGTDPLDPNDYPSPEQDGCSDSDGDDPLSFGICDDGTRWRDHCVGSGIVTEFRCLSSGCVPTNYYCDDLFPFPATGTCEEKDFDGLKRARCVEKEAAFCTDHDASYGSGATRQPSYCTDASGDTRDVCEDENTIREQECSDSVCTMRRWGCPAGTSCQTDSSGNGYCKDLPVTCKDYDASAGNEWKQRLVPEVCRDEVIGFINDYCIDDTNMKEAVCDINQECTYKNLPCGMGFKCLTSSGNGYCKDMCSTIGKKTNSCIYPPGACAQNYGGTLLPEYDNLCPSGKHLCCV